MGVFGGLPVPRERAGALSSGEIRAPFDICASDRGPVGSRNAAAFALMFEAVLRRSEAVSVQLEDPETGALSITGKGNRQRTMYAAPRPSRLGWPFEATIPAPCCAP